MAIVQNNVSFGTIIRYIGANGSTYGEFGITNGSTPNTYSGDMGGMNYLLMAGGVERMRMFGSGGNVSIGTTSDLARLAVQGSSASVGTAFLVQNSTLATLLEVFNNQTISLNGTVTASGSIRVSQINPLINGDIILQNTWAGSTGVQIRTIANKAQVVTITPDTTNNYTSGNSNIVNVLIPFAPTSGTGTMNAISISGTINQTGGANGTIRGIYYNPTITSVLGTHNAWESTSGDMLIMGGGKVGIGVSSINVAYRLEVAGDARFQNGLLIGTTGSTGWQFSSNTVTLQQNGFIGADIPGGRHFNITNVANSTYYFRVAPTTGNIIIGGTTDLAKLTVQSNSASVGSLALFQNSTPSNVFNILNNGFVGIGTNTPISLLHIGSGTSGFLGDFTTPAITFNTLNNGIYLDANRINFKANGSFSFGADSNGPLGNGFRINAALFNNLTTPIFVPYRLSLGVNSGFGGNDAGDISLITNNVARLTVLQASNSIIVNANTWFGYGNNSRGVTIGDPTILQGFSGSGLNVWNTTTTTYDTQLLATGNIAGPYVSVKSNLFVGSLAVAPTATLHVRGASATTGTAFLVQNSTPTDLFKVVNDGKIFFKGNTTYIDYTAGNVPIVNSRFIIGDFVADNIPSARFVVQSSYGYSGAFTKGISVSINNNSTTDAIHYFATGILNNGSGINTYEGYRINLATSGTTTNTWNEVIGFHVAGNIASTFTTTNGNVTGFLFDTTINQVGNLGLARGLYLKPTLNAVPNYIAIEATSRNSATDTLLKLSNNTRDVLCVKGDNKIGFYNTTPTIQGTTAMAASMYVNNGAMDLDTFGGYTLGQVVEQLRNMGILS